MRASWNDEEDDALRRLPWRARVVYLQGIRRFMDFRTGWAGKSRVLSYQFFYELLDCAEHTTEPDPKVSKRGLQTIFLMLERVGLVEWPRGSSAQRGVFFRCLLADLDDSVQKQAGPKRDPSGTQKEGPAFSSNIIALDAQAGPKRDPSGTRQAGPPPEDNTKRNIIPERETREKLSQARGARLALQVLPVDWSVWAQGQRPDLDVGLTWENFRDYWTAVPGVRGCKLDWEATWRKWVRNEKAAHSNRNLETRNGQRSESTTERRIRISQENFERAGSHDWAADEMG